MLCPQVVFNGGVAELAKAHFDGGQRRLFKAAGLADHGHCGLKDHCAPAHLAQLGHGAFVRAGLAQRQAIEVCHLVGADHHGVGKGGGHRMRLGQRQSLRQCGWHFAGERCFVNVGCGYGKWNAQPLQQLLAVARGRT